MKFISYLTFKGQLIGLIFHKGLSTSSGHYTAAINNNNIWYHCNDGQIGVTDFSRLSYSSDVYILFYKRMDNIKGH